LAVPLGAGVVVLVEAGKLAGLELLMWIVWGVVAERFSVCGHKRESDSGEQAGRRGRLIRAVSVGGLHEC